MRREIKVKLLKIASMEQAYANVGIACGPVHESDLENWPSPQSTVVDTIPTDDWSDIESDIKGSAPVDLSTPSDSVLGDQDTDMSNVQQRNDTEDHTLEVMLDAFGDDGMEDAFSHAEALEGRRKDLAKLAFHWTNVEVFAGIKRGAPPLILPRFRW